MKHLFRVSLPVPLVEDWDGSLPLQSLNLSSTNIYTVYIYIFIIQIICIYILCVYTVLSSSCLYITISQHVLVDTVHVFDIRNSHKHHTEYINIILRRHHMIHIKYLHYFTSANQIGTSTPIDSMGRKVYLPT